MIKPEIIRLETGPIMTNTYLIRCPETGKVIVVDPGGDPDRIAASVSGIDYIVYSHGHFDHCGGAGELADLFSPRTLIHQADAEMLSRASEAASAWGYSIRRPPAPTGFLSGENDLRVGNLTFQVLHTPGHSPGSVCLLGHGVLFSGDTLFRDSIGRTDLPGSSERSMRASLQTLSRLVPGDTEILPGHGPSSRMERELRENPFLS